MRDTVALTSKPVLPGQQLVQNGSGNLHLYSVPNAMPRAWAVHRIAAAPLAGEALRDQAYLEHGAPAVDACAGPETVSEVSRQATSVAYSATLHCRGLVMLAQTWDADWVAKLDGRGTTLWKADGTLSAVVVPAGQHRITLRYRPIAAYVGAGMTALGLLLLSWLIYSAARSTSRSASLL